MSPIERLETIDLGDEHIRQINLDIMTHTCQLQLSGVGVYRVPLLPKPFEYEIRYEPAVLTFIGVKKIHYPEWYCLNHLIVNYEVTPSEQEGYYNFSITMTGGWDNDTFMRTIEIVAKDFSINGEVCAPPFENE